jgi:hypothetical protein
MSKQSLSIANELFFGRAAYGRANNGKRGIRVYLMAMYDAAPILEDADGISASQSVVVATTPLALINGALAASGAVTLDVPRNVVGAWTGTAVLTITGTDQYGETMKESSASGTTMAGLKAFKTITSVSFSANVTSATVGTGKVLGMPVKISTKNGMQPALFDGAADAGTRVAAVTTDPATATTGDIRGTYAPAGTLDGTYGVAQYSG